jgi:CSLREA domain-containing protein
MTAVRRGIVVLAAGAAALVLAAPAAAKTYEVTKRADPTPHGCKKKDCSLREAVLAANNHSGTDKIVLPEKKTYNLSIPNSDPADSEDEGREGDLDLLDDVKITHAGKGTAKVDPNGIDRAFHLLGDASATIKKLGIRGGVAPEGGDNDGGAILLYDASSLTLVRSKLVGNRAADFGGALAFYGQGLTILGSKITNNTSDSDSGAMDLSSDGHVLIKNTTISGNRSLGSVGGSSYVNVDGGVEIVGTTISNNTADSTGGGLYVSGDELEVTNSTITGNHSDESGGGIFNSNGEVSLNAVTVARNSAADAGGGLFNSSPDPFEVENSLIAVNGATSAGDDCSNAAAPDEAFDSLGHNLLGTDAACDGFGATGDIVNPDPGLAKLKSNGGLTQTIALQKGSPAINKANKPSAPKKDQRGVKRGKRPDIGAYERVKKKKHRHHHH